MVMIESEWPGFPNRAPAGDGATPVVLYVYVQDVDEAVRLAELEGGRILMPLENQFYGDRTAWVIDISGHVWTVASRIEETTEEERARRLQSMLEEQSADKDD
jgi:PhnB protein